MTSITYTQTSSTINFNSRYLHFAVSYEEDDRTEIVVEIEGGESRYLCIYLPDADPDFWTFVGISAFNGKEGLIVADRKDKELALQQIYQLNERSYLDDNGLILRPINK